MTSYQGDKTTGFQSPAQDYVQPVIDLAERLNLRRPGIYPVRVVGQALAERGIRHGDVLVANAAADPTAGKVCVAFINSDVILATLSFKEDTWWLRPTRSEPVAVAEDIEIWAIVEALVRFQV
ncbi:S24 family peptidase [Pseudorhodoferax sp. LjRoot39]|uniref:LexA family protein n=1 Tax=Pseudorhodoferax sp. LjRoot39 TaxID=3342328 RepID=UPI003ED01D34